MKVAKKIIGLWTFLATIGLNPFPAMFYAQPERLEVKETGCDDAGRCSYVTCRLGKMQ